MVRSISKTRAAARGAGLAECLVLIGLVAVVALAGFRMFGSRLSGTTDSVGDHVRNLEGDDSKDYNVSAHVKAVTEFVCAGNDCADGPVIGAAPQPAPPPRQDNSLTGPPRPPGPPPPPINVTFTHPSWREGRLGGAFNGNNLNLRLVTAEMMGDTGWNPRAYRVFMETVVGRTWTERVWQGVIPRNGTFNGAMRIFYQNINNSSPNASLLRARLFVAYPDVVLVHGTRAGINGGLIPDQNARAYNPTELFDHWQQMLADFRVLDGTPGNPAVQPSPASQAILARLVQRALENTDGSQVTAEQLRARVDALARRMFRNINNADEMGFTMGVLIAGIDRVIDGISNRNQRRQIIEGGVFDGLAAAAGAIPPPGNLIISPAIVAARTARQLTDDNWTGQGFSRAFLGSLEHELNNRNQQGNLPNGWNHQDLTRLYNRVREVLHNNGYNN